jgi:hypothetical protein
MSVLAKAFSCADAHEQAEMLNTMARELFVACRGQAGFEMQSCYLSKELNKDGEALILGLAAFIELRRKEIQS